MSGFVPLVEREAPLSQLHLALARVRDGRGELAIVGGEAGAGKTSLLREFVSHAAGSPAVLWGACDPLSAPRPFGPLADAIAGIDGDTADRLAAGATRSESFAASLSLIDGSRTGGRPAVFVIEDAHWADDGTLDMLTFLGRRVAAYPTLLVVSYRDDEVGTAHPLRVRFGELTPAIRCRIHVPALTVDGVRQVTAGSALVAEDVHRMTNGNAFFVTEIVKSGSDELPDSVRDAVVARVSRLEPDVRAVLEAASIVPGRVDRWLLDAITGGADIEAEVEACVEAGLLNAGHAATLAFNHELARLAVVDAIAPGRRRELHKRALRALERPTSGEPDLARLAFHAAEADDVTGTLEYAPRAAAQAAALGAHREAVLHLAHALAHAARLAPLARAQLLERYGVELVIVGRSQEAVDAYDAAAAVHAQHGDFEAQALALVMTARPLVLAGHQELAGARLARAAELLAGRPPSRAAAMLATYESSDHMLARRFGEAERVGQRAMALADTVGARDILAEVSIQSGIALAMSGDDRGLTRIRDGIAIASELDRDYLVALGHSQIGSGYGEMRVYDVAVPALRDGITFAEARELGSTYYMRAWLGRCELELGHWDAAAAIAGDLMRNPRCVGISRFVALVTLGWLRGRRGDPDAGTSLDEALELARGMLHLQRLWPVAVCRAEQAWMAGELERELPLVDEAAALAAALDYGRASEELWHWMYLADGVARGNVDDALTPFGLSAAGRPDLAARRWLELGCPYEAAVARYLAGSADDLQAAHDVFDALGAVPMRSRTAAALRAAGRRVPRGPNAATRTNPGSLTDRELDVLALVADGRTNREIADRLDISVKTAGHHVSNVLAKLGVRSRGEAAVAALRQGIVDSDL